MWLPQLASRVKEELESETIWSEEKEGTGLGKEYDRCKHLSLKLNFYMHNAKYSTALQHLPVSFPVPDVCFQKTPILHALPCFAGGIWFTFPFLYNVFKLWF